MQIYSSLRLGFYQDEASADDQHASQHQHQQKKISRTVTGHLCTKMPNHSSVDLHLLMPMLTYCGADRQHSPYLDRTWVHFFVHFFCLSKMMLLKTCFDKYHDCFGGFYMA